MLARVLGTITRKCFSKISSWSKTNIYYFIVVTMGWTSHLQLLLILLFMKSKAFCGNNSQLTEKTTTCSDLPLCEKWHCPHCLEYSSFKSTTTWGEELCRNFLVNNAFFGHNNPSHTWLPSSMDSFSCYNDKNSNYRDWRGAYGACDLLGSDVTLLDLTWDVRFF